MENQMSETDNWATEFFMRRGIKTRPDQHDRGTLATVLRDCKRDPDQVDLDRLWLDLNHIIGRYLVLEDLSRERAPQITDLEQISDRAA
jgi:hypothetical protein